MALLEINDLSFEYNKKNTILSHINHRIEPGTINIILGLNGCGKTTLIKLLAGLLQSTSGNIIIDGKPVLSLSDYERSKLIAYVPQFASTKIAFTVSEYLLLSLTNQKNIYWRPSEKDKTKVNEFATRLGINENNLHRENDKLSGGERQIVMICGALLQDTKIIILDEPTAMLDMKNQYAVLQFLKKSHKDEHKTIIFSCHDPNHALRLGGNTIVLHNGEIYLNGESREIINAKNLKAIYGENVCDTKDSQYNFITINW